MNSTLYSAFALVWRADETLRVAAFSKVPGIRSCNAHRLDEYSLAVRVIGAPAGIRTIAQLMLTERLVAVYAGQWLKFVHFTVFNQGDRSSIFFIASHNGRKTQ
jgi:hypothetical protein